MCTRCVIYDHIMLCSRMGCDVIWNHWHTHTRMNPKGLRVVREGPLPLFCSAVRLKSMDFIAFRC